MVVPAWANVEVEGTGAANAEVQCFAATFFLIGGCDKWRRDFCEGPMLVQFSNELCCNSLGERFCHSDAKQASRWGSRRSAAETPTRQLELERGGELPGSVRVGLAGPRKVLSFARSSSSSDEMAGDDTTSSATGHGQFPGPRPQRPHG